MIMYHATDMENLGSILSNGIRPSIEGIVFLAETPEDAIKFIMLRGYPQIVALKVDVEDVFETFDHNSNFYSCRAFAVKGTIEPDSIKFTESFKFDNPLVHPTIITKSGRVYHTKLRSEEEMKRMENRKV